MKNKAYEAFIEAAKTFSMALTYGSKDQCRRCELNYMEARAKLGIKTQDVPLFQ